MPTPIAFVFAALGALVALYGLSRARRDRARFAPLLTLGDAPTEPLRPGPGIVSGVVELEGEAVDVLVGHETLDVRFVKTNNGRRRRLKTKSRRGTARSFVLRRDNGDRVNIEPGSSVVFVEPELEPTEGPGGEKDLSRTYALAVGDSATLHGELVATGEGASFRSSGARFALRANPLLGLVVERAGKAGDRSIMQLEARWRPRARVLAALFLLFVVALTLASAPMGLDIPGWVLLTLGIWPAAISFFERKHLRGAHIFETKAES